MKALLLALLAITAINTQATDPTTQLVNVLNTASLQLQALGTLTVNNNTYVQLVQVLNSVFGNMQTSVVPFYYSQMSRILNMNQDIAARIVQVDSNIDAAYNVLAQYIVNLANSYAGQLAGISISLQTSQLTFLDNVNYFTQKMSNITQQILALQAEVNQYSPLMANLNTQVNQVLAQEQALISSLTPALNPRLKSVEQFNLSELTLGSTPVAYCKSVIYNYPNSYNGNVPQVGVNINLVGNESAPNTAYDIILSAATPTAATIWICDRSLTTFTNRDAKVYIAVWSAQ